MGIDINFGEIADGFLNAILPDISLEKLNQEWGTEQQTLTEWFGSIFDPAIEKIKLSINIFVASALQTLLGFMLFIQNFDFGDFLDDLFPEITKEELDEKWANKKKVFIDWIVSVYNGAIQGATTILNTFASTVINVLLGIDAFVRNIDFSESFENLKSSIPTITLQDIKDAWVNFPQVIVDFWTSITLFGDEDKESFIPTFSLENIQSAWSNLSQTITDFWTSITLIEQGKNLIGTLQEGIEDMNIGLNLRSALWRVLGGLLDLLPFSDAEEGPLANLTERGKAIITTISNGITNAKNSISDALRTKLNIVAADILQFILNIDLFIRTFDWSGTFKMMTEALNKEIETQKRGLNIILSSILNVLLSIDLAFRTGNPLSLILPKITLEDIRTTWSNVSEDIKTFFDEIDLIESGKALLKTIQKGIEDSITIQALKNAFWTALENLIKLLPFSDAEEGPLKDLTQRGKNILNQLAIGLIDPVTLENLKNIAKSAFQSVVDAIDAVLHFKIPILTYEDVDTAYTEVVTWWNERKSNWKYWLPTINRSETLKAFSQLAGWQLAFRSVNKWIPYISFRSVAIHFKQFKKWRDPLVTAGKWLPNINIVTLSKYWTGFASFFLALKIVGLWLPMITGHDLDYYWSGIKDWIGTNVLAKWFPDETNEMLLNFVNFLETASIHGSVLEKMATSMQDMLAAALGIEGLGLLRTGIETRTALDTELETGFMPMDKEFKQGSLHQDKFFRDRAVDLVTGMSAFGDLVVGKGPMASFLGILWILWQNSWIADKIVVITKAIGNMAKALALGGVSTGLVALAGMLTYGWLTHETARLEGDMPKTGEEFAEDQLLGPGVSDLISRMGVPRWEEASQRDYGMSIEERLKKNFQMTDELIKSLKLDPKYEVVEPGEYLQHHNTFWDGVITWLNDTALKIETSMTAFIDRVSYYWSLLIDPKQWKNWKSYEQNQKEFISNATAMGDAMVSGPGSAEFQNWRSVEAEKLNLQTPLPMEDLDIQAMGMIPLPTSDQIKEKFNNIKTTLLEELGWLMVSLQLTLMLGQQMWDNWMNYIKSKITLEEYGGWQSFMASELAGLTSAWTNAWTTIKTSTKNAVNSIIEMLNKLITGWNSIGFSIGGFSTSIPDPFNESGTLVEWSWGGVNIETPNIDLINLLGGSGGPPDPYYLVPNLDTGGIVSSPMLAALAMNSKPEMIVPLDKMGSMGGTTVHIEFSGDTYGFEDFEDKIGEAVLDLRRRGVDIDLFPSSALTR